ADIVTHATTKYMDGHSTSVGGAIVDSGNFDWAAHAGKFPGMTEPDESYHGLAYAQAFGKNAFITKATVQLMRDLGSIPSPFNSYLLNVGLESLQARVERHCANAQVMAEYLSQCPEVAWIKFPGLPGDKYHDLAQKQFTKGRSSGVMCFGIKGGRERSIKFMDSLKLINIVTHVADAASCVLHPASHTHRQLTDEQLIAAGVQPDLIRFSVGLENTDDLIADMEQAFAAIK
ncbi:MAG: PLP-dependent transferase, partial [Bacteroidales bacterium]|nr:PLP-dependent transferase [Bacteroidales bacterium]